jgi:hypothetical protein
MVIILAQRFRKGTARGRPGRDPLFDAGKAACPQPNDGPRRAGKFLQTGPSNAAVSVEAISAEPARRSGPGLIVMIGQPFRKAEDLDPQDKAAKPLGPGRYQAKAIIPFALFINSFCPLSSAYLPLILALCLLLLHLRNANFPEHLQ